MSVGRSARSIQVVSSLSPGEELSVFRRCANSTAQMRRRARGFTSQLRIRKATKGVVGKTAAGSKRRPIQSTVDGLGTVEASVVGVVRRRG